MMGAGVGNFFVFLGPPGAGKGTQAKIVAERLGLPHISSGDLFRENLKNMTELGKIANGYIQKGELVPDDVTIAMVRERLKQPDCKRGAILDGFPRTPAQADALKGTLEDLPGRITAVPFIKVPEQVLIERLSGRWTCRAEGHVFHTLYSPPRDPGRCDIDGSELYQRDDDRPETVAKRIRVYLEQTQPLIDYYKQAGVLVEINGDQPIEKVTEALMHVLGMVN
jgi:adenylate kinase